MKFCRWILLSVTLSGACIADPNDQTITLGYNSYPPYKIKLTDDKAGGLVLAPFEDAFTKAGLAFVWQEMPHARQIAQVRYNTSKFCAVGMYKTPEREAFGKYTNVIYKASPFLVVTNRQSENGDSRPSLNELFGSRVNSVVLVLSKSYGSELDTLIESARSTVSYADNDLMIINMLAHNHGQYTLFEYDKIDYFRKSGVWDDSRLVSYSPKDAPRGENWYAICSKKVDDATIEKINKFLPGK